MSLTKNDFDLNESLQNTNCPSSNVAQAIIAPQFQTPIPLHRELPPASPFPIEALGSLLGGAAQALSDVIQAPEGLCGQSVLAAAALACQAHRDVIIDGRLSPISCFFLSIGLSGERKSSVDSWALRPHRTHQDKLRNEYDEEIKGYRSELEAYKRSREDALKAKSLEAKKDALEELGDEPEEPLRPFLLVEEPSYEGLVKLLAVGQPALGLFSDEGGRFVGGHGMSKENSLKTAAGLSSIWDGKPISRVRSADGSSLLVGRRLSVHLMMQRKIAEMLLGDPLLLDQGLLSRCLATSPESKLGTRFYKERNIEEIDDIKIYNKRMEDLLNIPWRLADGTRNELEPERLTLDSEAKQLWIKFHDAVESQLNAKGSLAGISGLAAKIPEHSLRLASVLALVGRSDTSKINAEFMANAILLSQHYLDEALRLFESGSVDIEIQQASKVLEWLKDNEKEIITLIELYQFGPNNIREASKARRMMEILVNHYWANPIKGGAIFDGKKRKEAWRLKT